MTSVEVDAGRRLRILYVAYPLLPVSENSAGGAEQVLWTLEREIQARGKSTTVAATARSRIAGELFETGEPAEGVDQVERRAREQTEAILARLRRPGAPEFDLVHDMSGGFWRHAGALPMPVLATLHLARSLYKDFADWQIPERVSFNCVSRAQMLEFSELPRLIGAVRNGIALERFPREPVAYSQREYLLWLGRICEEKGTHTALDVAHAAGEKLIVAGSIYPFLYHQKYYAREVIPRMKRASSAAKYVERPSFAEKVELLRNARALLITSEVNESSSLVAMEAAACGTPVVALRRGALSEVIAEGITGFLVDDAEQMRAALNRVGKIDAAKCRAYAEENYSATTMADGYLSVYRELLSSATPSRSASLAQSS